MTWLNRLGMALEFLSFWFAAPEVITELREDEGAWLVAIEAVIEALLLRVFAVLAHLAMPFPAARLWEGRCGLPPLGCGQFGCYLLALLLLAVLGAMGALVSGLRWLLIPVGAICVFVLSFGILWVLWLLLPALADDSNIRRRALKVGVALFVGGFILQMIATF